VGKVWLPWVIVGVVLATSFGMSALAEEAAPVAAVAADQSISISQPLTWKGVLEMILSAVLVALASVGVTLVNSWAAKVKAEANSSLKGQAEQALARIASNIANKQLKELQTKGAITKDELHKLGQAAIDQLKSEFAQEGIDVVRKLGQQFLESSLRYAVDHMKK